MKLKGAPVGGLLVVLALSAWQGWEQSAAAAPSSVRVPEARFTDTGADGCLRCHGGDNMAVLKESAHGNPDDPHAPFARAGCESCHGPGSLHVSRARGGAGFPALTRFGRGGDPAKDQLAACLDCHASAMGEREGMAWSGSLHDTGRMTCSTCHTIHAPDNLLADPVAQQAKCATCHDQQIADHSRFEGKGILFDQLTCHDCHDAHQLQSRQ
jgi:DmsE family decaheme c-type cytochrome